MRNWNGILEALWSESQIKVYLRFTKKLIWRDHHKLDSNEEIEEDNKGLGERPVEELAMAKKKWNDKKIIGWRKEEKKYCVSIKAWTALFSEM
jgi:hypothetical protein